MNFLFSFIYLNYYRFISQQNKIQCMEEATLKKLAILCCIIGLFLLFYTSNQIQECVDISTITIDDIGRQLRVCGTITSRRVSSNHIFLDVKDKTGTIKFVIFNTTAQKLNKPGANPYGIRIGHEMNASGVVEEYPKGTGRLELIYRRGNIEIY